MRGSRLSAVSVLERPDGCPLTSAEWRTLLLLAQGLTYEEIARRANRRASTVRTQLAGVFRKLEVGGGIQAVAYAFRAGWFPSLSLEMEPVIPALVYEAKLPPSQWAYMTAFDDYVHSRARHDRARMVVSFYGVQLDVKLKPKQPVRVYHPERRLLVAILRLATPDERIRIARNVGLDVEAAPSAAPPAKSWGP